MFNNYHAGNYKTENTQKVNAVTGTLIKTDSDSWFERIPLLSERALELLTEGGHKAFKEEKNEKYGYTKRIDNPEKNIIILQIMLCGDMEVIVECKYQEAL
ncbi:MAG: hypothetical protein ACRCUS_07720 [Anaerovoracaceae bacterium]